MGEKKASILKDDTGQATVEYILILSAVVVATISLFRGILSTLDKGILTFGAQLEKDLKTGRARVDVWQK